MQNETQQMDTGQSDTTRYDRGINRYIVMNFNDIKHLTMAGIKAIAAMDHMGLRRTFSK
jgi:hypothetical protein